MWANIKFIFSHFLQGAGAGTGSTAGVPHVSLSTMSVEAVCEKLKQIDGLDQSVLPQYSATIKKVSSDEFH